MVAPGRPQPTAADAALWLAGVPGEREPKSRRTPPDSCLKRPDRRFPWCGTWKLPAYAKQPSPCAGLPALFTVGLVALSRGPKARAAGPTPTSWSAAAPRAWSWPPYASWPCWPPSAGLSTRSTRSAIPPSDLRRTSATRGFHRRIREHGTVTFPEQDHRMAAGGLERPGGWVRAAWR